MAYLDDLRTARDTLAAALAANIGKPNVSFDGESYDWESLVRRLRMLDETIASAQGPVEVETHGVV